MKRAMSFLVSSEASWDLLEAVSLKHSFHSDRGAGRERQHRALVAERAKPDERRRSREEPGRVHRAQPAARGGGVPFFAPLGAGARAHPHPAGHVAAAGGRGNDERRQCLAAPGRRDRHAGRLHRRLKMATRALVNVPAVLRRGVVFEVRTTLAHAMETGYRRDGDGRMLPRDIVRRMEVRLDGERVFAADLHPAIAANPYVAFPLLLQAGGSLQIRWTGDQGFEHTETLTLVVT